MKTIEEHWQDFFKDLPPGANENQVATVRQAFAAGALSGLVLASRSLIGEHSTPELRALVVKIVLLGKP